MSANAIWFLCGAAAWTATGLLSYSLLLGHVTAEWPEFSTWLDALMCGMVGLLGPFGLAAIVIARRDHTLFPSGLKFRFRLRPLPANEVRQSEAVGKGEAMSEKRFEANTHPNWGWAIYDNHGVAGRGVYHWYPPDYYGGAQIAAEAEAARLNAWWEAEQAKKAWRPSRLHPHRIDDSSGHMRMACYDGHGYAGPALAERVCRLLNEDEARTK